MMMTQEREILKAQEQFEALCEVVREASREGYRVNEVERELFAGVLKIGHGLLESVLQRAGDGDEGETVERDAETLQRSRNKHKRRYVSVFGEQRRRHIFL